MNAQLRTVAAAAGLGMLVLRAAAMPPPSPPDEGFLRGPRIDAPSTPTLVKSDARGQFVPLEGRPVAAAAELVVLDTAARARVQEQVEARATRLGMMLVDHIDRVREATDALRAGDADGARAVYRALAEQFDPGQPRDPLLAALAEIVTPAEHEEITRLVNEYWDAWVQWETRADPVRDVEARRAVEQRLAFSLFQQELAAAYNWTLRPYRSKLESLYAITEATPEQRAAIRAVIIDYVRDTRLEPTPEQRRRAAARIYDLLDEAQRRRVFTHALWQL